MIFKINDIIDGLKTIVAGIATLCSAANDEKYSFFFKLPYIANWIWHKLFYQITQIPASNDEKYVY